MTEDRRGGRRRVRVGIDLVSVAAIEESIDRFGSEYLSKVFTDAEVASARTGEMAPKLAARFAAKEATIKVLEPDDEPIDWRSIEVVQERSGACRIVLSGTAADLARRAGIRDLALSLTHETGSAVAVVVARCSRWRLRSG
jgi:holo-[acyl-carrier protein] synthase